MQRYPLFWPVGWKRQPAHAKKAGRFSKRGDFSYHSLSIADAASRVLVELDMLGVEKDDSIISTNLKTRRDGLPYSDQPEPSDAGAAVYWKRRGDKSHKVMAIDIYHRVADNLAAIAATLEAMRAIERHGGAQIMERAYTGFDALPAPERTWREVFGLHSSATPRLTFAREIYQRLAKERHPDTGGSHELMTELNAAWEKAQKELWG